MEFESCGDGITMRDDEEEQETVNGYGLIFSAYSRRVRFPVRTRGGADISPLQVFQKSLKMFKTGRKN